MFRYTTTFYCVVYNTPFSTISGKEKLEMEGSNNHMFVHGGF